MLSLSYMNLFRSREARCENLVLTCIDFRFRRSVGDVLALAGYAEFDHLALPGGSNAVIDEASRPTVLRALTTAVDLHGTRRLIIVDHVDCGAYGGSGRFPGAEAEEAFHCERLGEAERLIQSNYPNLEVVPVYMDWEQLKPLDAAAAGPA